MTTKAALATDDLGGKVEVWACAMPTDLGDLADRLRDSLEKEGITLLVFDWPTGGLSPLAVLLAAARTKIVDWAHGLGRSADAAALDRLLREVEAENGFANALVRLESGLKEATAGLAALARLNWDWAHEVLSEPLKARSTFGQLIVLAQVGGVAVPRESLRRVLAEEVGLAGEGLTVILGGEGSGKSWLVADWWLEQRDVPVLLYVAGPLHAALDSNASGEEMIAALLSQQHGDRPERWIRRIIYGVGGAAIVSASRSL